MPEALMAFLHFNFPLCFKILPLHPPLTNIRERKWAVTVQGHKY